MTQEQRDALIAERSATLTQVMRTTMYTFTALAAIIAFAPGVNPSMMGMLVVGTMIYGILAGRTNLNILASLAADVPADSAYGKAQASTNYGMLTLVSSVVFGLIGLTQLYVILS